VLQCVAACCSVLQCDAVWDSVLRCVVMRIAHLSDGTVDVTMRDEDIQGKTYSIHISALQYIPVCCSVLQCVAVCCSVLQCVAVCCSVLQCVVMCCSVSQRVLHISVMGLRRNTEKGGK